MKLILSRKGFDSTNGGCASPILEDGSICPIPIPQAGASTSYAQIAFNGVRLAPIVEALTRGRLSGRDGAHLDPDLRRDALERRPGWSPIFGQAGAAASHLAGQGVGAGDLFLFFGWFRRAEGPTDSIRFVRGAPDLHVIFGWMQIGSVHPVDDALGQAIPWARRHPHLDSRARYPNNTVYLARDRLTLAGVELPGAGVFNRITPELILTQQSPYLGRSVWQLPRWFHGGKRPALSRHGDVKRWRINGESVQLRSVPIGQEFVMEIGDRREADAWLRAMFSGAT
jgi:hypothetical protein